jgi:hypothetical protein
VPPFLESLFGITLPGNHYYVADEPARVLGCKTAVKFCNFASSGERRCYGSGVEEHPWADVWPNKSDQVVMRGYLQFLMSMFDGTAHDPEVYCKDHLSAGEATTDSLHQTIDTTKGLPSLKTRFTLRGLMQPAQIPPTRWQEEMEYIFQTNLAATQARFVEYASGELPSNIEAYATICGSQTECKRLCNSQVNYLRTQSYLNPPLLTHYAEDEKSGILLVQCTRSVRNALARRLSGTRWHTHGVDCWTAR